MKQRLLIWTPFGPMVLIMNLIFIFNVLCLIRSCS